MYQFIRPLLFGLDAERAHRASTGTARIAQAVSLSPVESLFRFAHPSLHQTLWGHSVRNPVGLAAGFDKNGRLVHFWGALGFGLAEVGSVSANPSEGNPRPRAFRLPDDRALINRMGLNNEGAERVAARLRSARNGEPELPLLGINLAKTHDPDIMGAAAVSDFRASFRRLAPLADYIALNISCPNTREGKTFEAPDALDALLAEIFAERAGLDLDVPVLLKLSPPLSEQVAFDSQLEEIVALAQTHGVHGFIATNTASDRAGLTTSPEKLEAIGPGGLSGPPLAARATRLVRLLYRKTSGELPIIGVGGVDGPEAAYRKIRAGASLVQCYTGLIYEGPGLVKRIKKGLVRLLERDGFGSVGEAVGVDA